MTNIKKTLDKTNEIITKLINKVDTANPGDWINGKNEKKEITDLLTYLQDKSKPKPVSETEAIDIDLGEIEKLETTLTDLTDENTRLTTENTTLTTKTTEQDEIITGTTIPELISKLEAYASKVSDSELKTTLTAITTQLTSLKQEQEKTTAKINEEIKQPTDYWKVGGFILGAISFIYILLGYIAFFKKEKDHE